MQERDKLTTKEAMKELNIKSVASMCRLAKTHNLTKFKQHKQAYYLIDEIMKLKTARTLVPNTTTAAPRRTRLARLSKEERKAKKEELAMQQQTTPPPQKPPNNKDKSIIALQKSLEKCGLYEECDAVLIQSYVDNEFLIKLACEGLSGGVCTYDERGEEVISASLKAYDLLMKHKISLAKALGIGASNRKGVGKPQEQIDAFSEFLDG